MKRLVADTGPILHLHEAEALFLLSLVGDVFLPPMIVAELRVHAPSLWNDTLPKWVHLQIPSADAQHRALEWRRSGILHGGEADALGLACEIKPDWFLTDDAAARIMAESLGIESHGSIGVILWAAANKLVTLSKAERCLIGLETSSLWMSQRVRREAKAALAKLSGN